MFKIITPCHNSEYIKINTSCRAQEEREGPAGTLGNDRVTTPRQEADGRARGVGCWLEQGCAPAERRTGSAAVPVLT